MADSFERLTKGVTEIYKSIQKIKRIQMKRMGLRGPQVMCIYYLYANPDGLTGTELCQKCSEDKSGISRILAELEQSGLICYRHAGDGRRYRAKAVLTKEGMAYGAKINPLIECAAVAGRGDLDSGDIEVFYKVLFSIAGNLSALCRQLE